MKVVVFFLLMLWAWHLGVRRNCFLGFLALFALALGVLAS